ncbi:MAG: mechanosensitive ion channel family protein, partial [Candidatus Omnitrophota bacterium]
MNINNIFYREYFGNSLGDYALSIVIFAVVLALLWFFKRVALSYLKKLARRTQTDFDDFFVGLLSRIGRPFYLVVAFYFAARQLDLGPFIDKVVEVALVVTLTFRVIRLLQDCLAYFVEKMYLGKDARLDNYQAKATRSLSTVLNWVIWIAGAIFLLDNLGIKISAVIAGMGIGGVAVALAAQSILGDLFSSFAIFLDKPFRVGDFIIIGDLLGCVEHVGIKTTRIRSLHGEEIVFSNSDLTNSRIRNYKRMRKRRVAFRIGVTYQATSEQLEKIPGIVAEIIRDIDKANLDRAHFFSFGDFSLVFEIVYYVDGNDYNFYMDIQEKINLGLKRRFEEEGIEFAYPTQT